MHSWPWQCTALLLAAQLHCAACRWAPSRREAVSANALFLDDKLVCDGHCPDAAVSLLQQSSGGPKRKWPKGEWNLTLKAKLELQQQKQQPDQRRDQQNTPFGTAFPFHSLVHLNSSTSSTTAHEEAEGPPQVKVVRLRDLEKALRNQQKALQSRRHDIPMWLSGAVVAFLVVGVLVAALAFTAVLTFQRILGSTVAEALREALRWNLGVKVTLGRVNVSAFQWTVQIHDLVLQNPEGFSTEEALMSAELISVSPEVLGFVLSKGKHLTITELILSGVAVHVEYRTHIAEFRRTNVGEVLHQMKGGKDGKRSRWLPRCFPAAAGQKLQAAGQSPAQVPDVQEAKKRKTDVVLRHVLLADMSLRLANADGEGPKPHLDLGRLEFGDFSHEGKFTVGHDILAELLRTALAHMLERMSMGEWLELVRARLPKVGGASPAAVSGK